MAYGEHGRFQLGQPLRAGQGQFPVPGRKRGEREERAQAAGHGQAAARLVRVAGDQHAAARIHEGHMPRRMAWCGDGDQGADAVAIFQHPVRTGADAFGTLPRTGVWGS